MGTGTDTCQTKNCMTKKLVLIIIAAMLGAGYFTNNALNEKVVSKAQFNEYKEGQRLQHEGIQKSLGRIEGVLNTLSGIGYIVSSEGVE